MAVDPKQLQAAFLAAVQAEPAERLDMLDRLCAGDVELRRRVELLLRAHDDSADLPPVATTGDFTPAPDANASPLNTSDYRPTAEPGVVIAGRYTLVENIGEGGMGEVWVAKQSEPVKRKVALKLIKAGMDTKAVLQRFEAERQALAMMDHPNIARVLDGGMTDDRRPFFVMELVKGLPLTKFCDDAKLTPRLRLELFVLICQAVQHAHQKGIVHRDLKPSNILVTIIDGTPIPKVIDFGVAKATAGRLTDESMSTAFGAVVGTLEYMSPEQAGHAGDDVDTRADIYSLGVILYELLTGLRPIDAGRMRKAALVEMIRMIHEEEPSKPSTRLSTDEALPSLAAVRQTDPKQLMAMLRGELDWVVMKCLEKQRHRRYETANALARDIQRYLADEMVEARPPTWGYRLKKYAYRNRVALGTGIVFILTLKAVTLFSMWQAGRAMVAEAIASTERDDAEKARAAEAEQRAKAEKARDRTRDVLDAMTSQVTGDSLATQKEISADQKKFLTEVLTYYQEFVGENADDEKSRLRAAKAALRVGQIEYRLGRAEEAAAANRRARDYFAALAAEFPAVAEYRQEMAVSHTHLGLMLVQLGKRKEATEQYGKAMAIQEKLAVELPDVAQVQLELAGSHDNLGMLLVELGQNAAAEAHHRKGVAIREKLATEFPAVAKYRHELAGGHNNLGVVLAAQRKRTEAVEQYRMSLEIQEKLATDFPAVVEYRLEMAKNHINLGIQLTSIGERAEAEEHYRKALSIQTKLVDAFPAVPAYRQVLARNYINLAILLKGMNQPAADEQYRKSIAIFEQLAADFPTTPIYRKELASVYNGFGGLFMSLGQRPAAEEQFRKAVAVVEKLALQFPADPNYRDEVAKSHTFLGLMLQSLGKGSEAKERYLKAMAIQEKLTAEFPDVAEYRVVLGGSYCNFGNTVVGSPGTELEFAL